MVLLLRVEARPKLFPYTTLFRSGFRTRTSANLPGTTGTIETVIRGLVTTGGVDNLVLTMTGPAASAPSGEQPDAPGTLEVQGSASWSGGLQAEADLVLDRFPWFGLIPGRSEEHTSELQSR